MRAHRLFLIATAILLLILLACSSRDKLENAPGGPTENELNEAVAVADKQQDYYGQAMTVAAGADTAAAIDSLLALVQADPDVEWAEKTDAGVNVRWKSGMNGVIVLRLRSDGGAAAKAAPVGPPRARDGAPIGKAAEGGYRMPKNKKTLVYSPCYSEFKMWEEDVFDSGTAALPRAGYQDFRILKDEKATLAELKSIGSGGYGIVRIASHGSPWPSENDIQEVYLITGEETSKESFAANWEMIEQGHLAPGAYAGGKRYFADSYFFAAHNDFGDGAPLVSLGFCFGWRGNWPGDMMTNAKAGAVTGWDWEVVASKDAAYFTDLLHNMCDTSRAIPLTVKRWHATGDTSYTETDGRVISFHCKALPDSFGLWSPIRIDTLEPNIALAGDTITVAGTGFGAAPGRVLFDETPGTPVLWRDYAIRVIVPSAEAGEMLVYVEAADKRKSAGRPFNLIDDSLVLELQETSWTMFELYVPCGFDGDQAGDNVFEHLLQTIRWNGTSFSGGETTRDETGTRRLEFSGTIGRDGRMLNLVYTAADTITNQAGNRTNRYEHVRVTDLPYDPTLGFRVTGSAIRNHLSEMQWHERRWDAEGALTYESVFREAWWDTPGYKALSCDFGWMP
ncbi:MAG: IPT/TIG domain-containing protein [Candidatus Eisenbacteria bacterium]|nr:IPT/TIG domain-containing protein [Candidatus Eisenbacteria bacterium]